MLGGRSTVGQRTLTPLIGVRIPASQPNFSRYSSIATTYGLRVSFGNPCLASLVTTARTSTCIERPIAVSKMSPG
jgi:hypothetical protein